MAEVYIHPSLARFTNNQRKIMLNARTINDIIPLLCDAYPELGASITRSTGELTPFVNLYINNNSINSCAPETNVLENDRIDLVTALVGG